MVFFLAGWRPKKGLFEAYDEESFNDVYGMVEIDRNIKVFIYF